MSDIRLILDNTDFLGDFVKQNNDIAMDEGLESAVFISLFTDARAPDGTVMPDGSDDKRGWWADSLEDEESTGSLLWLIDREKEQNKVARRAKQYAENALRWMTEDKVAKTVVVDTSIITHGELDIRVAIQRPTGDAVEYRYEYVWESQAIRRL